MRCDVEPERSAAYRYRYAGCRCNACSSVHAASARAWRERNRKRVEARNRQPREEYVEAGEQERERKRAYYEQNRKRILARQRARREQKRVGDRDYPAAHAELARRIAETGGIVAEYATRCRARALALPGP